MLRINTLVVIFLSLFLQNTTGCYHSKITDREVCNEFEELFTEGNHKWINVLIQQDMVKPQPLRSLKANTFRKTPNLLELSIGGMVNYIEPGAFDDLQKLDKISMYDNELDEIPSSLFDNLPIRNMQFNRNGMKEIKPKYFENTPDIRQVDFRRNKIKTIQAGVFNNKPIHKIYLDENEIETIEDGAFTGMTNLNTLSLSGNRLTSFETKSLFGSNTFLKHLWVNRNKLTKISAETIQGIPNIMKLYLEINQIHTIEENAFANLADLQFLDLSNNQLIEVQPRIFPVKGLKHLEFLFLHNNRFTFINIGLLARAPKLEYVTYGGNPLQCACLESINDWTKKKNITQLCDDVYFAGERPTCVVYTENKNNCVYDADLTMELYETYKQAVVEYPALPLKCLTLNGPKNATLGVST